MSQVFINGFEVAYNSLLNVDYLEDFEHGLAMLIGLNPNQHVTQLIGFCADIGARKRKYHKRSKSNNQTASNSTRSRSYGQPVYITEYHPFGNAANFSFILHHQFKSDNQNDIANTLVQSRFNMCMKYVDILTYLHDSPLGTRVMCDSNDIVKTLSQFLLTPDLGLVVNDLDATPEVVDDPYVGIKCGHRQLFGDFVAPEQLWTQSGHFNDTLMNTYDEQIDIWRIPDMCSFFLGPGSSSHSINFHLFNIHKQCKNHNPHQRPSAKQVQREYQRIWNIFAFEK